MNSFVKKIEYQTMGVFRVKKDPGILVVRVTLRRETPGRPRHGRPVLASLALPGPTAGVHSPVLLSAKNFVISTHSDLVSLNNLLGIESVDRVLKVPSVNCSE